MATFRIPKSDAENPTPDRQQDFPEGTWSGVVEAVRIRTIRRGDNADFLLKEKGEYFAEEAEIGSIQIGQAEAVLEGQEDPGNMKHFDENIYFSIDGVVWDDPEVDPANMNWRFEASRRRLTNLALAVDAVEEDGDSVGPVDHFDTLLRETDAESGGGLYGSSVLFEVYHRRFKRRDGTPGAEPVTRRYDVMV